MIDNVHGEAIICKIINTRNTFTAHWAEEGSNPIAVTEICNSKLGKLLDELNKLSITTDMIKL